MFSKTTYVVINLPKEYLKYLVSSRPWSVHLLGWVVKNSKQSKPKYKNM